MTYLGRTVEYFHDVHGRIGAVSDGANQWTCAYNDAGLVASVDNEADGLRESRTYDAIGRLLSVDHARATNNATVFRIAYALGPDGNRLGATETREDGIASEWAYEYDALGRLVRERRDVESDGAWDRDVSYEYDGQGNRLRETYRSAAGAITQDRRYYYEPNSQRLSHIDEGGVAVESFTWTPKGELATHTTSAAGTRTFAWGEGETLEAVAFDDGARIEYDYDDTGTLVARRAYSAAGVLVDSESYLVDRENPTGYSQTLADLNAGTGAVRKLYTFGDRILAQEDAATAARASHQTDGLGSIRGLTSGGQTASINYTAFGTPLEGAGSLTTAKYAFTGQPRDPVTQLQYHRARWLDPGTGRWAATDSLPDLGGNYLGAYSYARQSPTDMRDIRGLNGEALDAIVTATIIDALSAGGILGLTVSLCGIVFAYTIVVASVVIAVLMFAYGIRVAIFPGDAGRDHGTKVILHWMAFLSQYFPEHARFLQEHRIAFAYCDLRMELPGLWGAALHTIGIGESPDEGANAFSVWYPEPSGGGGLSIDGVITIRGNLDVRDGRPLPEKVVFNTLTHELTHIMLSRKGLSDDDKVTHEAIAGAWGNYAQAYYQWYIELSPEQRERWGRVADPPLASPPPLTTDVRAYPVSAYPY